MKAPTILSTVLGVLFLALSGPMALLATVGGESCTDGQGQPMGCEERLTDGSFWLRVEASAISSVASPWDDLAKLLLPMFGVPVFLDAVRKKGAGAELAEASDVPG